MNKNKRVTLTEELIDEIWSTWVGINGNFSSRMLALTNVAALVGCSFATANRVVCAFQAAISGEVLQHDPRKYPNKMMVEYINKKFSHRTASNDRDDKVSDIRLLAESINNLAEAIRYANKAKKITSK